jgi:hypothetical protein
MSPFQSIRNRLRALMGQRIPRQLPRRGPKPRIGSHIVHVESGLRLTVQAGLSDELWLWLLERGWRVVTHRPDRRHYRDIPGTWVTLLFDSDPVSREKLMAEAISNAASRATVWDRSSG